jgi:ribonuclease BN (tRNA processing enzyme)
MLSRRLLLQTSALTALLGSRSLLAANAGTKLVLLGTQGGPNFNLQRGETASLLVVDGEPYVIDCGYGTLRALVQSGTGFLNVGNIFLTHLHDDHTADLVALLSHQWTQGRVKPTTVYGPHGTDKLVEAANLFSQANSEIRSVDEARSVLPSDLFKGMVVQAMAQPVTVLKTAALTITAIENTHYPDESKAKMAHRALAYRFEAADRSVVFSGDTAYSTNLVQLAKGAEVLVCEAMNVEVTRKNFDERVKRGYYADNPEGVWKHIADTHTSVEDAGRMAAEAGVKTLVLNHILPGALTELPDSDYIASAAKHFNGTIVVGKDQMVL